MKDSLVDWYIKNVILPKFVNYESPGYIITEQDSKNGYVYRRSVFFPEKLLIEFENKIIQRFGEKGKLFLYGVGKNFGWNYGKTFNTPTIANNTQKEVREAVYFLSRFIGAIWANECTISKLDIPSKNYEVNFKDYVVCSTNGHGYILNEGGIGGLGSWMLSDFSLEASQTKCQGRHDPLCTTICTLPKILKEKGMDFRVYSDKIETDSTTEEYITYNKIMMPQFSNTSMRDLITNNIVKYANGKIEYNNERYVLLGIDLLYLLELQAKKLKKGQQILFDSAFETGYIIAKKESELTPQFMSDFVASQGWGDLSITPSLKDIGLTHYPWHELFPKTGKETITGLLSGFISAYRNESLNLRISSEDLTEGNASFNFDLDG